jgi:hypothetical protein
MSRWYARVGTALAPSEHEALHALMDVEPLLEDARIVVVTTWREAAGIAREMDADAVWWDHEEAQREKLWFAASERMGEAELLRRLDAVTTGNADVEATVAAAAARAGFTEPEAVRDAIGALLLAAHHNALAGFAGGDAGHPFARKYALFAGGRWPLGYHHGRYVLF